MPVLPPNCVRVQYRLHCAPARTCVPRLAAVRRILFFVLERRSTPFARRPVPQPLLAVAISDSTTVSASSGGVDACNSGLACALYSFATSLSHPVLMGASPSRVGTLLWGLSCTSKDDRCTPLLHVLPWRTVPGQATLSSQCLPSHKLSSSCSSWCIHFILARDLLFSFRARP